MLEIVILGSDCPTCDTMGEVVEEALRKLQIKDADIEHVTDIKEMVEYGVTKSPSLVVDGTIVVEGEIPSVDDVAGMILDVEEGV